MADTGNSSSNGASSGASSEKKSSVRAIVAASIGNGLEFYDFSLYAFFAVYIAHAFFPEGDETVQLIQAFIAFGLGFVVRPLGAIVLGSYGDRVGRKAALIATIIAMAIGTLIIAIAPTYAAIGIGAPILVVFGRLLQGFSAGGEIGGATTFLVEHAPPNKKGAYAAWIQASMAASNILAVLMATIMTSLLSQEAMHAWGWRVPFIFGLVIAPVGYWLFKTLEETPQFQEEMQRQRTEKQKTKMPFIQLLHEHPRELLVGFGFSVLWVVCVYTLIMYLPTYMHKVLSFSMADTFRAAFVGNCVMVVGCLVTGRLADRYGRYRILTLGALGLLFFPYPLLLWLTTSQTVATLYLVQTLFCALISLFVGVAPLALAEIFSVHVRTTGVALAYNIASLLFGFTPAFLTWLAQATGSNHVPAWYVMAAAVVALISIYYMPKKPELEQQKQAEKAEKIPA